MLWRLFRQFQLSYLNTFSCLAKFTKKFEESLSLLPPPGGYVIILVCICVYVCAYVCAYVCLSVNTITQKIINIWTSNFAHTFAIA